MNVPVIGNGMTIGYTNGVKNVGLLGATNGTGYRVSVYNKKVSTTITGGEANIAGLFGLTTEPGKSGIIVNLDNVEVGTISSLKLGNYILKY